MYAGDEIYDDDVTSGIVHEKYCDEQHFDGDPCNHEERDEDDYEPDPEVEERRAVLNLVMERHPDMAFTGESVQDYLYNGGEIQSAREERDIYEY